MYANSTIYEQTHQLGILKFLYNLEFVFKYFVIQNKIQILVLLKESNKWDAL